MKKLILIFEFLLLVAPCQARIITVDDDGPADFDTIQAAINDSNDGDTVIVAPGTYTGDGNRDIDFYGLAITVRSTDPNDPNIVAATIIDCNGAEDDPHRGFYFHSGEDANSMLNGFTITNGSADYGGGICFKLNSSPTILNCVLIANSAKWAGGGVYSDQSSPVVTNCTFKQNLSNFFNLGSGGGMCNYKSCPTVINCLFIENIATRSGGGMDNYDSNAVVEHCIFIRNEGSHSGGAMANLWGDLTITSCVFVANKSPLVCWCYSGGGAISDGSNNAIVTNCLFNGNSSDFGGAIIGGANLEIRNCTFIGNKAGDANAISSYHYEPNLTMSNCILRDGGNELRGGPFNVTYSNVQGGWPGIGNIDADPCFVNAANYDYHLLPNSPCVDAGDPNYVAGPNETDLDGNPRLLDGDKDGVARVDMGAHEYWPPIEVAMTFTPQTVNCGGKGKWVKAQLTFPEEIYPEDIDVNSPAIAYPMEVESESIKVLGSGGGSVKLKIVFDRQAFCEVITEEGSLDVTVVGYLVTGQEFEGTDTVTIFGGG